uniref:DUF2490 domain-containing protein n=1 Tax=Flavobacterium sp. TaxID=239 RepID=UPI00404AF6D0
MKTIQIIALLICLGFTKTNAQTIAKEQNRLWFGYMTETKIANHFSWWNDTHWAPESFFLIRTGLTYHFDNKFKTSTTLGYARLWIYPSEKEYVTFRPEHRIWGQTVSSISKNNHKHLFRFRYEARFRHHLANDELIEGYNFNWRFRFMYQFKHYFPTENKNKFYGVLADEYLLHYGEEITNTFRMDQNRLSLGFGYQMDNISLQLGYMNIISQPNTSQDLTMKHTLVLWVFHKMDLRKSKK